MNPESSEVRKAKAWRRVWLLFLLALKLRDGQRVWLQVGDQGCRIIDGALEIE